MTLQLSTKYIISISTFILSISVMATPFLPTAITSPPLNIDFYTNFWEISPDNNFDPILYSDPAKQDILKDIAFKSMTGYGITNEDNNDDALDPAENLNDKFSEFSKNPEMNEKYKQLIALKEQILKVEQCYANLALTDEKNRDYLKTDFGPRKPTKLERKLAPCSAQDINSIINQSTINISDTIKNLIAKIQNTNISTNNIEKYSKQALKILHTNLLNEYQKQKTALIISINKDFSTSDKTNIENIVNRKTIQSSEDSRKLFDALTDVVSIKTGLPTAVFKADSNAIISNGGPKVISTDDGDGADLPNLKNYRAAKQKEIDNISADIKDQSHSFGILKLNAISGLSTIISERFVNQSEKSLMSELARTIDDNLKAKESNINTVSDETKNPSIQTAAVDSNAKIEVATDNKVKPSKLLLQIRDNLSINNKLAYMRYLALEKTQLSLTTLQIAQLKDLADEIKKKREALNKLVMMFDAGSNMTDTISQQPKVTAVN